MKSEADCIWHLIHNKILVKNFLFHFVVLQLKELVARWILEKAGCKKPIKRLWISSVTDKAIREGFANLNNSGEYVFLGHF